MLAHNSKYHQERSRNYGRKIIKKKNISKIFSSRDEATCADLLSEGKLKELVSNVISRQVLCLAYSTRWNDHPHVIPQLTETYRWWGV